MSNMDRDTRAAMIDCLVPWRFDARIIDDSVLTLQVENDGRFPSILVLMFLYG